MASQPSAAIIRPVPAGKLEPNAIGVAQDTVIGMASSAPAASIGLTLAALAAATAYGSGPVIVLTAIPMLIIANSYRRLNLWNANCGASFEWVGRAINPYLGFLTGWLMITGYVIGAVAGVEVIGPSVLAVFTAASTGSTAADIAIATGAVGGHAGRRRRRDQDHRADPGHHGRRRVRHPDRLRHRRAGAGPAPPPRHGPGHRGWFTLSGVGGHGSLAAGLLLAVFIYSGWEGTLYVNEEVKHRRVNPGRAAIIAVAILTVIYALAAMGLQGTVSPQSSRPTPPQPWSTRPPPSAAATGARSWPWPWPCR